MKRASIAGAHVYAAFEIRRFPPLWSIEDIGAAYVVKDSAGQKLGYFYYEEERPVGVRQPSYSAKTRRSRLYEEVRSHRDASVSYFSRVRHLRRTCLAGVE